MKLNVKHMRRLFPLLVYSTIFLCDDVLVVELPVDVIDGTSLLIMVGVVLDTLQQIESHLLMRHYDGLTKSGRIKGRTGGGIYGTH